MKISVSITDFLTDKRLFFFLSVGAIVIVQFDFFGRVGLVIYGLLLVYSFIFSVMTLRREHPKFGYAFFFCFAFLIWYLIASCINGKYDGIATIIQMMFFSLIAFMPRDTREHDGDVTGLSKMLTVAGIFMGAGTALIPIFVHFCPSIMERLPAFLEDYLRRSAGVGFWPSRVVGPCSNPNTTAGFCLISSVASTYLISSSRKVGKWFVAAVLCIVISFIAIFLLTASRTAMLAFLVFFATYTLLFLMGRFKEKRKTVLGLIVLVSLVVLMTIGAAMASNPEFADFIMSHMVRIDSLQTGSGRLRVYSTALDMFFESPIVGVDYADFKEASNVSSAHNIYLQVLVFSGIPGGILFLGYALISLFHASKNYLFSIRENGMDCTLTSLVLAFLTAYFVYGCTEGYSIDGMRIITVAAYLALAFTHALYEQTLTSETCSMSEEE